MPDKAWKANERSKSRELGGERRGPTGRDHSDCTPIPLIAPEFKLYKRLVFLEEDWRQAAENAAAEGRMPVLSVKEGGRGKGKRDRVELDWPDFRLLYHLARGFLALHGDGCVCVAYEPEHPEHVGIRPCPPELCERPDHDHSKEAR